MTRSNCMSHERRWSRQSRKLIGLLLAVTVPPAVTLIWLGIQLLEQDRSLGAQRELERRQATGQAIVHALDRSLVAAEAWLDQDPVPAGMIRVTVSPQAVLPYPGNRVLWVNGAVPLLPADDRQFVAAEQFEYHGDAERAAASYAEAARSSDHSVRAGALLRLARVRRRQQQWDTALASYRSLTEIRDVAIAGAPVDFQARRAICAVLADAGRMPELAREATALEADLLSGRWLIDRAAWELAAAELQGWTNRRTPMPAERQLFSAVTDVIAQSQANAGGTPVLRASRSVLSVNGSGVTLVSRTVGQERVSLAIAPDVLRAWIAGAVAGGPDT